MAITVNKIYTDITVTDEETIRFPDEVVGGLRAGSLDHLTKARNIAWGKNMTALIEPGVIPSCCSKLLLPVSYFHPVTDSNFECMHMYVHQSNIECAMHDRHIFVWKGDTDTDIDLPTGFSWNNRWPEWVKSRDFDGILVRRAQSVPPRSREELGQDMMSLDGDYDEYYEDADERARTPSSLLPDSRYHPFFSRQAPSSLLTHERRGRVINDQIAMWKWAVAEAKKPIDMQALSRKDGPICDVAYAERKLAYFTAKRELFDRKG